MKKTVILILAILPIVLLITIAFAGRILALYQHIPVEKVEFVDQLNNPYDVNDIFEINVGDEKLTAICIYPELANDKEVSYSSSNEEICTVDEKGKLTGVSVGSARITVTTHDGNKTAYLNVLVKADKVIGVDLPIAELTLTVGDGFTLVPTVNLPQAKDKRVMWGSDNEAVVTIDQNGNVVAHMEGTAIITVETFDGGYTDSCIVTVVAGTPPLAFDFSSASWISQPASVYLSTQAEINLSDFVVFDETLIQANQIQFKVVSSSGKEGELFTLSEGVLTLLKQGVVEIKAYVGDKDAPTYESISIKIGLKK
jgi:hypothetical protein